MKFAYTLLFVCFTSLKHVAKGIQDETFCYIYIKINSVTFQKTILWTYVRISFQVLLK
jgi:hypothetical protein